MIYFTSDQHFDHKKMLETRPQFKTLDEMNDTIIQNFNSKVTKNDITYMLGDFCWSNYEKFFDRLNGRFVFIFGNHDTNIRHDKINHLVKGFYDTRYGEQKFTVCHYPMISWNCSHWGSWLFHGHHHSKTKFPGKVMNVSVDALDFFPISWDEVVVEMEKKEDNWDLIRR